MAAVTQLYNGPIHVHYGFIYLMPDRPGEEPGDLIDARMGQANGLCGVQVPHQVWLVTGLHTGNVLVRVEWVPEAPTLAPASVWEDVVEASVDIPCPDLLLESFDSTEKVRAPATGWHRLRFCVTGMDAGRDMDTVLEDETALDRYLLQMWPAPEEPDCVVRQSSETAAYWHGVARGGPDEEAGDGLDEAEKAADEDRSALEMACKKDEMDEAIPSVVDLMRREWLI